MVNLFLIGAPKCGTTSLASMLDKSKDIYLPSFKEPHFFLEEKEKKNPNYLYTKEEYLELYNTSKKIKYKLDASVWYYQSKYAANKIFEHNINAKIILVIRNPLKAIRSLYIHRYVSGAEFIMDINEAILVEDLRKKGYFLPNHIQVQIEGYFYTNVYLYAKWIELYKKIYKDNLLVLKFEDLINGNNINNVLSSFLEIDSVKNIEFPKTNTSKNKLSQNRTLKKISKFIPIKFSKIKPAHFINDIFNNFLGNNFSKNIIYDIDSYTINRIKNRINKDLQMVEGLTDLHIEDYYL